MRRQNLIVLVVALAVLAVAPALTGCAPRAPESPSGKVTGQLAGVIPTDEGLGWDCKPTEMEFEYLYNIHEVGPNGAASGSAHCRFRPVNPTGPWLDIYLAVDCVHFTEVDGNPSAIYSGKVIKATLPECFTQAVCDWEGQLKIGRVVDGGTGGDGDEIVFWQLTPPCFDPDEGVPLGCIVPEGSQERTIFTATGGDVVVQSG